MSDINKSIKNFTSASIFSFAGQGFNFIALVYLARVLDPKGYGVISFAQSLLMYFYILSDFGISFYTIKVLNQEGKTNKELVTVELFSVRFYTSMLFTFLFIILIFFLKIDYSVKISLYFISCSVLFLGMTCDFIFNAFNDTKYLGLATFFKYFTFSLLCLFFIKSKVQVPLVCLFYTISLLITMMLLYFFFKKKYFILKITFLKLKDFTILKKSLPYLVALAMVQINSNFDIIYLSFTKSQQEVGYYSAPYKIVNFLISILAIYLYSAYPTIAELLKKSKSQLNKYLTQFYQIGCIFVIPIVFGGIALSPKIIPLVFGAKYQTSILLLDLLLPLIFIRLTSSVFGAVLNMSPSNKQFTYAVIISAIINIILNIFLTPYWGARGSAVATIICEFVQVIYMYIACQKYCNIKVVRIVIIPIISTLVMCYVLSKILFLNIFIDLISGILVYFVIYIILTVTKKYVNSLKYKTY